MKQKNSEVRPKDLLHLVANVHPLVWTLLISIYGITKLTLVAHGSIPTILALVSSTPLSATIIATVIASITGSIGAVFFFTVIGVTESVREGDRWLVAGCWLFASILLGAVFIPRSFFLLLVIFTAWMIGTSLLFRYIWPIIKRHLLKSKRPVRFMPTGRSRRGEFILFGILLAPMMIAPTLTDNPWLPSEIIIVKNSGPLVGYVVITDDTTTKVLVDNPRKVTQVPNIDIVSREICMQDSRENSLVLSALWSDSKYSSCH